MSINGKLTVSGDLTITGENLYDYRNLEAVDGNLCIDVSGVEWKHLKRVVGELRLDDNAENSMFPALTSARDIALRSDGASFPVLHEVNRVFVYSEGAVFDVLERITGKVVIGDNGGAEFPALTSICGELEVYTDVTGMPLLTSAHCISIMKKDIKLDLPSYTKRGVHKPILDALKAKKAEKIKPCADIGNLFGLMLTA
jgi:hypothetical protein